MDFDEAYDDDLSSRYIDSFIGLYTKIHVIKPMLLILFNTCEFLKVQCIKNDKDIVNYLNDCTDKEACENMINAIDENIILFNAICTTRERIIILYKLYEIIYVNK